MHQRMDLGGKMRTGDDETAALVGKQIPRTLLDPFEVERGGRDGSLERGLGLGRDEAGECRGQRKHVAGGNAQAMIGHAAGER